MTVSEFYAKYANVPLDQRMKPVSFTHAGLLTLAEIHKEMNVLEDAMRPLRIRERKLLELATLFFKHQSKKK